MFCRSGCSLYLYLPLLILRYNPYFFIFVLYCSLSGELIGNICLSDIRNYECVIQFCRSSSFRVVRRGMANQAQIFRYTEDRYVSLDDCVGHDISYKAGSEHDWIHLTRTGQAKSLWWHTSCSKIPKRSSSSEDALGMVSF